MLSRSELPHATGICACGHDALVHADTYSPDGKQRVSIGTGECLSSANVGHRSDGKKNNNGRCRCPSHSSPAEAGQ
jgi:hypothetical protein